MNKWPIGFGNGEDIKKQMGQLGGLKGISHYEL